MTVIYNGARQVSVKSSSFDTTFAGQNFIPYTFMYSFAVQGGAIAALTLTAIDGSALTLPAKTMIFGAWIDEGSAVTGGAGATVALGYTGSAAGLLAATLVSNAIFATPNTVTPTLVTGALPLKVTSATSITATPAINTLTAGIFYIHMLTKPGA